MDDDDRILAYLQGSLQDDARAAFEQELATRRDLRAQVAALRAAGEAFAEEDAQAGPADAGWERLVQSMDADRAPANLNRRPALLQFAAVAVGAIAVWQFLAVPFLPGRDVGGFAPVTEVAVEAALRVGFAESAEIAELTALLDEVGARIVDGPGALGLYTLAFEDADARDAAEAVLAARSDIVLVVARP